MDNLDNIIWRNEWVEVCKRAQTFKDELISDGLWEIYQNPINEMSIYISDYEPIVIGQTSHIYNTICNICCLEHISDSVLHWKQELHTALMILYNPIIKKKISKRRTLIDNFITPCVSNKTFEPEEDDLFIRAMNVEINKAKNDKSPNRLRKLKEAKYIEEYILPSITIYRKANAKRIATFLKSIVDAIVNNQEFNLNKALDTFIESTPYIE